MFLVICIKFTWIDYKENLHLGDTGGWNIYTHSFKLILNLKPKLSDQQYLKVLKILSDHTKQTLFLFLDEGKRNLRDGEGMYVFANSKLTWWLNFILELWVHLIQIPTCAVEVKWHMLSPEIKVWKSCKLYNFKQSLNEFHYVLVFGSILV